jgi:hypothetical protein
MFAAFVVVEGVIVVVVGNEIIVIQFMVWLRYATQKCESRKQKNSFGFVFGNCNVGWRYPTPHSQDEVLKIKKAMIY